MNDAIWAARLHLKTRTMLSAEAVREICEALVASVDSQPAPAVVAPATASPRREGDVPPGQPWPREQEARYASADKMRLPPMTWRKYNEGPLPCAHSNTSSVALNSGTIEYTCHDCGATRADILLFTEGIEVTP